MEKSIKKKINKTKKNIFRKKKRDMDTRSQKSKRLTESSANYIKNDTSKGYSKGNYKKKSKGGFGCWANRDSHNCNVETIEINVINNSDGKTSKISISKNKSIFNEIQTYFKITKVFYGGIELEKNETAIEHGIEDDAILYITINTNTKEEINENTEQIRKNTEETKKIAEGWKNALYNCDDGDFWKPWKCNCTRHSFNNGYRVCRICRHPVAHHYKKNLYTGEKRYFSH